MPSSMRLVHRLERLVVDTTDDLVEGVVHRALTRGLGVPGGETVLHAFAEATWTTKSTMVMVPPHAAGARAGRGRCPGERPAGRRLHVRVAVDAARHDVLARGVGWTRSAPAARSPSGLVPGTTSAATVSPSISTSIGLTEPVGPTTVPPVMRTVIRA